MRFLKFTALCLCVLLLFSVVSCKKEEPPMAAADSLGIALSGEEISEAFADNPNPLYAANDTEFAIGTLVAPTLMRYDTEKGWQPLVGNIEVEEIGGKTVATVTVDTSYNYTNGRKLSIKDYEAAMKRISSIGYDGYYSDYHKNPIEGLIAYRYGTADLAPSRVPDFSSEADEKLADLSKEDYKSLLIETAIAGIYPEEANPQSLCPDGRTFKNFVVEETKNAEERQDTFFIGSALRERMLEALAGIYAAQPKNDWLIEELKKPVMVKMEKEFATEMQKNAQRTSNISGISFSGSSGKSATVTFYEKVDRDEAIRILNLPMIYDKSQAPEYDVHGAGEYRFSGFREGSAGYILNFSSNKHRNLSVMVMKEDLLLPTLYMGQISAVCYSGILSDDEIVQKYKLSLASFGTQKVVYDPDATDLKELETVKSLFER